MISTLAKKAIKNYLPNVVFESLQSLKYLGKRIPDYEIYQSFLKDKAGLEIGGPSTLFKTTLPVYQIVGSLDGVNFAENTMWEGAIRTGKNFNYIRNKSGQQFVSEATNLEQIKSSSYDFIISSNCLEHVANPVKAIEEWKRVLKNDGFILLALPNKENNFDHRRNVTSFEHLLDDYENEISESDLMHLDEILELHDLSMDAPAGNQDEFRLRSLNNFKNRTLHHHVFDIPLITKMLEYSEFEIIRTDKTKSDFLALGHRKLSEA